MNPGVLRARRASRSLVPIDVPALTTCLPKDRASSVFGSSTNILTNRSANSIVLSPKSCGASSFIFQLSSLPFILHPSAFIFHPLQSFQLCLRAEGLEDLLDVDLGGVAGVAGIAEDSTQGLPLGKGLAEVLGQTRVEAGC